jgi:hypothetical protein
MNPMPSRQVILLPGHIHLPPIKPDISPDWRWRISMKTLFLAAFTALSLTVAVVPVASAAGFHNGSTVAGDAAATRMQQTGAYSR